MRENAQIEMTNSSKHLETALTHALRKIDQTLQRVRDGFPHITERGRWQVTADGSWTGGLWVGQLWWAYEHTGQDRYRQAALALMERLERWVDSLAANFDLGFLFEPSFVYGYRLTGDERLRDVALRAADRMLDFYHPQAELIYTVYEDRTERYGRPVGSAIVDIMMNLGLLWWAGEETGKPDYHAVARRHAERTAELHVRPDGSTFHVVDFDLDSGKVLHRGTIHGYANSSTWTRGQAWAVHGFILAYQATHERSFWEVARRLSDYFLERLPADGRPYWDLDDPAIPDVPRDTSAAAIAAAGWLRLPDHGPGRSLRSAGRRLVGQLVENSLTAEMDDGILAHATAYKRKGVGVDEATVWGDYFLLMALSALEC